MSHNHCFGGSDHQLRVYSNISELIANQEDPTPLVKLNKIVSHEEFQIYLKLERYNPFGSVKDRIALAMLNNLDRKGKTVIEPSSGNTGIALAALANAMDIPIEIAVPRQIPEEKKTILRLLGPDYLKLMMRSVLYFHRRAPGGW
jgi:cysteine synthase A/cysteine synthase B